MTVWHGLAFLLGIGLLIFLLCAQAQRLQLPVRFTTSDELAVITQVAWWAQKQIGAADPRHGRLAVMAVLLGRRLFPIGLRISAQDLEILAPFIDQFIAGQGSPWPLSAEYEDRRPQILSDFKTRMKAEGLWPEAIQTASATAS